MRFTEDTPAEQARARTAVAEWRQANPEGTAGEMLAALGSRFQRDYGPFLRSVLHRLDEDARDRQGGRAADADRALGALGAAWGSQCDEIGEYDGEWYAHLSGAPEDDYVTAAAPDELDAALRATTARSTP